MTDEQAGQNEHEQSRSAMDGISRALDQMDSGQRLATIGAAALLTVWALFDVLIDEYAIGQLHFALALVVVYVAYRKPDTGGVPIRSIVFACAALIGLLGVWDLVEELRNGILDADATTVIGALGNYAASIVAGLGALQMRNPS